MVRTRREPNDEPTLSGKEKALLAYFTENPNRLISREELALKIWRQAYFPASRTIDRTVAGIRRKRPALRDAIKTIRAEGYVFATHAN